MESDQRYYWRRASEELYAAARAMTPAGQNRRRQLAELYVRRLRELPIVMIDEDDCPTPMAHELQELSRRLLEWPLPRETMTLGQAAMAQARDSEWPLPHQHA
jgi:hypothetical protein